MRIILFTVMMCFAANVAFASVPLPSKKPNSNGSQTSNFQSILEKTAKPENDVPHPPKLAVSLEKYSIITPPPLPDQKRNWSRTPDVATMIDGIPVPDRKPLKIRTVSYTSDNVAPYVPVQTNVIAYQGNDDERTASRSVAVSRTTIERTQAQPRERIRETSEQSPFKTAQLPRAGRTTAEDPVIIFFKENSSELEVGQLNIIKSDILNRLKNSPSRKVAVYGYAERNRNNPDKTNQLSLSRALLISEYLADNRIRPDRIEARSMGDDTPIEPKDRVDVVIF